MTSLSIVPGTLDITAAQGKTWSISITVRDANNALINFTGYSATWQVRSNAASTAPILSLTVGSGITLNSVGVITLTASAAQTAAIAASTYVHELELTDPSGNKPPFLAGLLQVISEIVR